MRSAPPTASPAASSWSTPLALNWYVNRNVRFMFDFLHGDVAKQVNQTNFGDIGSKFNAFAMRTQVAL